MLTKCYFCGGKVKEGEVGVDFRWGEKLIIFEDVPARVCQQCGEKFLRSEVYKEMESIAQSEGTPSAPIAVDVINFKEGLRI